MGWEKYNKKEKRTNIKWTLFIVQKNLISYQ